MISIITSTIYPPEDTPKTWYRNTISSGERLSQTLLTINSLKEFEKVYLFDNSGFYWQQEADLILKDVLILKMNSYQFVNKGISEIFMLLNGLSKLPDNTPIFKISGRYQLTSINKQALNNNADFACLLNLKKKTISTRGYYVRNKRILEMLLVTALNYIYSYSLRVVGPRSLKRVFSNIFFPDTQTKNFFDPTISIEQGMFYAIIRNGINVNRLDMLNVKGQMAGSTKPFEWVDE